MAGVRTLPVEQAQTIYAGTDFRRQFRWLPDGQHPQDFTGWSALMLIGRPKTAATLELTSTPAAGVTLTNDGIITVHLTAAQTTALAADDLIYVLDLTDTAGFVQRFLHGRIVVVRELDRAP